MNVKDIMTENPACCSPDTSLTDVARMMAECDCGSIPVVDQGQKLVGVITDRDIVCRTLGKGLNPMQMQTRDCMSSPAVSVTPETDLEKCFQLMERNQVRRIPVVDNQGRCCGIVSQADIARKAQDQKTSEVLKEISQPTSSESRRQAA